MRSARYKIANTKFQNFCCRLSDSLLYFKRTHHRSQTQIETDVFADFWSLAYLPKGHSLSVFVNGSEFKHDGPVYFFIPEHSIVIWKLPQGVITWQALISTLPLNTRFKEPIALVADCELENFVNEKLVADWLSKASVISPIALTHAKSVVAEKTKSWIDEHYTQEIKIADIGQALNVSNAYLTKEFKRSFGISPIEYRNKKRIYKAMQLYMYQTQVTNKIIAFEVGFNEYSRFTKNFHKLMNARPSDFKPMGI